MPQKTTHSIHTTPTRLLERDGTMMIEKDTRRSFLIYNFLMTISWQLFLFYSFASYIFINVLFTLLYKLCGGLWCLGISPTTSWWGDMLEIFYFSTQTFTTVGYGFMHPICGGTNVVASIEMFTGLVFFSITTALFYTKFTKPHIELMLSKVCVFDTFKDGVALKFMLANSYDNKIVDVEVTLDMIRLELLEGRLKKRFYQLYLFRKRIPYLSVPWTVVHPIDDNSPLYGMTQRHFEEQNIEFFVQVKFFDEAHSQTLFQEFSFFGTQEVLWGHKFVNIQRYTERGELKLTMTRFGKTISVEGFPHRLSDLNV